MLAVIGILTMLAFTILPSVMDQMGSSMSVQDPVVATANGETLRQSDISQMVQARFLANQFMQGCLVMAAGSEQMANFRSFYLLQRTPGQFFGSTSEEEVMRIHLLAAEAKRVGIVVSDEAVNKFLRDITEDKVPSAGYASLVKQLNTSQMHVFSALRTELAAERLASMSAPNAQATPAQRWDYYRRLKQRASLEVVPVRVAEFLDEVDDPSNEELQAFFNEHKEQEPNPLSPTPGFKVPKQAAFQYFVVDYEKFYDESAVTQEEIEKHYEQYKDQRYLYAAFDSPEFDQPASEEKAQPGEDAGAKDESEPSKPDAKSAEDVKPAEDEAKPAAKEPAGKEPAEKKPVDEKPAGEKPAESKSAEEKPAEDKPDDEKDSKSDSQSSLHGKASQLVAAAAMRGASGVLSSLVLADAETEASDEKAVDEKPAEGASSDAADEQGDAKQKSEGDKGADAEEKAAAEEEAAADKKPDGGNKSEAAADAETEKPAANDQAAAQPPAGPPPPISDDLLLPRDIRQGPTPKYAPLWRVEASIRKELAGQKAVEKMTKALDSIQAKMRRFSRNLGPEDDELDEDGSAETKRSLPDFSKLAKAQQLSEHATGLLTALAFRDKHPALAEASPETQGMQEQPRHFIEIAYGVLPELQSAVVKDLAGNRYLAWKTDEKEAYVPELSDVRDEVERSWKMIKARELARKRAETLAGEAQQADKSLRDAFSDRKDLSVATTPSFTWLTRGAAGALDSQTPARLSEVEGVQDAGPDFMREAFSLGVGETGQAMNQPQTICYVIRVVTLEPSREFLRNTFMVDAYSTYAAASLEDRQEAMSAWIKGIENEAHLTWKRPPDERQQ